MLFKRGRFAKRWLRKAVEGVFGPVDLRRVVVGAIGLCILTMGVMGLMHADNEDHYRVPVEIHPGGAGATVLGRGIAEEDPPRGVSARDEVSASDLGDTESKSTSLGIHTHQRQGVTSSSSSLGGFHPDREKPAITRKSTALRDTPITHATKNSHGGDVVSVHEKIVAVLVSNYGYRELAMNAICTLKRVGISTYVLLSLDEKMHEFARKRRISSIPLPRSNNTDGSTSGPSSSMSVSSRSSNLSSSPTADAPTNTSLSSSSLSVDLPYEAALFGSKEFVTVSLTKTAAVLSLLNKGVDVLFLDVDVSLVRDPTPILEAFPEDIITTSDIMFVHDDPTKRNYRLNSGLFLARPTPQVKEAFQQMARLGLRSGRSQQKAFNWVLCGQYGGVERGRGKLVGDAACEWRGRTGSVSTRVLPLDTFPNGSGWGVEDAVAIHHNYVEGVQEKIDAIRKGGRWYYSEDAEGYCNK